MIQNTLCIQHTTTYTVHTIHYTSNTTHKTPQTTDHRPNTTHHTPHTIHSTLRTTVLHATVYVSTHSIFNSTCYIKLYIALFQALFLTRVSICYTDYPEASALLLLSAMDERIPPSPALWTVLSVNASGDIATGPMAMRRFSVYNAGEGGVSISDIKIFGKTKFSSGSIQRLLIFFSTDFP